MRGVLPGLVLLSFCLGGFCTEAATGRVIKVLPHFLDLEGRNALSPSLYDRDAYQARLRAHPEQRSGVRFDIQWKNRGPVRESLKLRVDLRGMARGDLPQTLVLEQPVQPTGWFSKWDAVVLSGAKYKEFGEVTAWKVTLWDGETLLGELASFLW